MTELLYGLLITLLVLYAVGFGYETIMSFWRLSSTKTELYPSASWEIIHTTLVLAFATFMVTHGPVLPDLAPLIMTPFLIAVAGFFLRGALQLLIFFQREKTTTHTWADWAFAVCHLVILVPFLYATVVTTTYLVTHTAEVLTDMLVWFIPGLLVGIAINLIPIVYVLKNKHYL